MDRGDARGGEAAPEIQKNLLHSSAIGRNANAGTDQKRLLQIIDQHKYQTVTIVKHDGKTVRLTRKVSFKVSETKNTSISPPTEKT